MDLKAMVRETEIFGRGQSLHTCRHCEVHEVTWKYGSLIEIIYLDFRAVRRPNKVVRHAFVDSVPFDTLVTGEMGGAVIVWRWRMIAANIPSTSEPQPT